MNRWHGWLIVAPLLAFARMPVAHAGAIYKCTIDGSTVYRDQPCSVDKPEAGRLSGRAAQQADPALGSSPAALMEGLRRSSERGRELRAQHDRELDRLKARMAGERDRHVQQREVSRFNRGWQERFAENERQREALVDRIRQLCPGGASGNRNGYRCNRRK